MAVKTTKNRMIVKRLVWLWVIMLLGISVVNIILQVNIPSFPQPWHMLSVVVIVALILMPLTSTIHRKAKTEGMKILAIVSKCFSILFHIWVPIAVLITVILLFCQ